jgi:hypothetical protein
MQFTSLFSIALALPALISATACVAGGPAWEVTAAGKCCKAYGGTWYQFYAVQAICVVDDDPDVTKGYNTCVAKIGGSPALDTKCVPGDGGLSVTLSSTSSTSPITLALTTTTVADTTTAADTVNTSDVTTGRSVTSTLSA